MMPSAPKKAFPLLREFLYILWPQRAKLGVVFCSSVVLSVLNMSVPYTLKIAVDTINAGQRLQVLFHVAAAILVIYVAKNVLYYFSKSQIVLLGERVAFRLRNQLMTHLYRLSVGYYSRQKPGKISARLIQDVETIKLFICGELIKLLLNALMLVVAAIVIIKLNTVLALIALAVLPLNFVVYRAFSGPIRRSARVAKEQVSSISGDLVERFSGVKTVKAAVGEAQEQERFARTMRKGMLAQIAQYRFYLLQKISADTLVGFSYILLFAAGGWIALMRVEAGAELTSFAAEFAAFFVYLGRLYPLAIELVADAGKFAGTSASVDRVYEILRTAPEVHTHPRAFPYKISHGKLEFRNVGFGFGREDLFKNVSFRVDPGEQVLLTGPAGCGKTTLLHLIPRFYDCRTGDIHVDSVSLNQFTLPALRGQVSFVFEDSFLFDATVVDNIRYARPAATETEVIAAAREAQADVFIRNLPRGYATRIGEGGIQLSYTQRQRISIARALAGLDTEAHAIAETLRRRAVGRTMLIVTHQPSLFPEFDKELRFEAGEVRVIPRAPTPPGREPRPG
ncbi:MAG: ABC transporter ATP-binding protein [Candidatus Brocadiia bacterium]|nr:ABC transporter ATP-binding protein [Candidatus Brocadiia bacterium]